MKFQSITAAYVLLAMGNAATVSAQPPNPGGIGATPRPAFSPYLNLTRPGNSPGVNYYGLVRPQQQFRQSMLNLQGSVNANQQQIGNIEANSNGFPATGRTAGFLNYNSYFMNAGQMNRNQGGFGAANTQGARFTNQNIRTPQPGFSGVNPGGNGVGGVRRR